MARMHGGDAGGDIRLALAYTRREASRRGPASRRSPPGAPPKPFTLPVPPYFRWALYPLPAKLRRTGAHETYSINISPTGFVIIIQ